MRRILLPLLLILFVSCKKDILETSASNTVSSTTIAKTTTTTTTTATTTTTTATATSLFSVLPKRVAFGAEGDMSSTSEFIQEADYRYCYLADDIFTGGWQKWQYPNGEYARAFMSETGKLNKIPVFTYYNIVPAKGRFQDPGFTNLQDPEVMNKYFEDFKYLLQLCNTYGKTVIIHYEPDLMGYMEMFKNDPTKTIIKVDASGQADVKGFSNDAKGLCQAILSLRNKYAPHVLLGWQVSTWATGVDLVKSKANPELLATATAAFYESLNAPFDLFFSEFSDRDAGYYQYVNGDLNAMWATLANAADGNLSDFDRFQRFLKQMNLITGKKTILWQIPIGNTRTKTCNNTSGHYTDNRAEYFLQPVMDSGNTSKITQYAQAGVIAFLFGQGAGNCTSYWDMKADGVTGTGDSADDDGGYLRKAVKAYYQKGPVAVQ